jgi:hypothetical protein
MRQVTRLRAPARLLRGADLQATDPPAGQHEKNSGQAAGGVRQADEFRRRRSTSRPNSGRSGARRGGRRKKILVRAPSAPTFRFRGRFCPRVDRPFAFPGRADGAILRPSGPLRRGDGACAPDATGPGRSAAVLSMAAFYEEKVRRDASLGVTQRADYLTPGVEAVIRRSPGLTARGARLQNLLLRQQAASRPIRGAADAGGRGRRPQRQRSSSAISRQEHFARDLRSTARLRTPPAPLRRFTTAGCLIRARGRWRSARGSRRCCGSA